MMASLTNKKIFSRRTQLHGIVEACGATVVMWLSSRELLPYGRHCVWRNLSKQTMNPPQSRHCLAEGRHVCCNLTLVQFKFYVTTHHWLQNAKLTACWFVLPCRRHTPSSVNAVLQQHTYVFSSLYLLLVFTPFPLFVSFFIPAVTVQQHCLIQKKKIFHFLRYPTSMPE